MDLHLAISLLKELEREMHKTPSLMEFSKFSGISCRQIKKVGYRNLCKKAGIEPNDNTNTKKPYKFKKPEELKILVLDIETTPINSLHYRMWNENIRTGFILRDWSIFSFAGSWLNEKKVHYADTRNDLFNDLEVCKLAHRMILESDLIVGWNSDRFDLKKLNTRFIYHGLPPVDTKKKCDLMKVAKKYFSFTSNKLNYVAKVLGIGEKIKSRKWTNEEMWLEMYHGNQEAFKHNKRYNIGDVELTKRMYHKLSAWDESLNFQSLTGSSCCPRCGHDEYTKEGYHTTKTGKFQKVRCANPECLKKMILKENLLKKDDKHLLKFR